jgi:hypothetical protein
LSERADREIDLSEATPDYVETVLTRLTAEQRTAPE